MLVVIPARRKGDAKGSTGDAFRIEGDEMNGRGNPKSRDRQIIGAKPKSNRSSQKRCQRSRRRAGNPAAPNRPAETAKPLGKFRRGQQSGDIGTNGDEARHTDIEQSCLSPLQI